MRKMVLAALAAWLIWAVLLPPVYAGEREETAVARALQWLETQQLPDGGFGPVGTGQSVASMTADIVYALGLIGEDPDGPRWTADGGQSALDALAALAPGYVGTDAGQAGKVARAVAVAGGDPRSFGGLDLIATIEAAYDPATGRYHPSFAYRHTLAIEALLRAGATVPAGAALALRRAQLPDGGWFWSFNGTTSDVDTTGRVLQLLGVLTCTRPAAAYERAASYLEGMQLPGGGWNVGDATGAANANSTALAAGGLRATGFDPQAARFQKDGRGGLDTLLSFQEPSGAFVYIQQPGMEEVRLMATADALAALAPIVTVQRVNCRPAYLPLPLAMLPSATIH